MSNIIVEGFGTYGIGTESLGGGFIAGQQAMLSGIWASPANAGSGEWGIGHLPFDPNNDDLYLFATMGAFSSSTTGWRRVLPNGPLADSRYSFFYAMDQLPTGEGIGPAILWADESNNVICAVRVTTTGALAVIDIAGAQLAVTAGPVMVAETAVHLEMKIDTDANSVIIYSQGRLVLNATGLAFSSAGEVAQFQFIYPGVNPVAGLHYGGHLIVRDSLGDLNNTFPVGERKVATIFPFNDDVAHQGWANHPILRFGVGVLDTTGKDGNLTQGRNGVTTPANTHTDLDDGDFTIEGQFRFQSLPIDANKAVVFGKWDEVNNKRSYQLYLGGPDLEHGLFTFRTSTDGLNGTVVNKLQWVWEPDTGTWYELALVRSAGELLLFIDGVQQGLPVADTDFYYAGSEVFALMTQIQTTSPLANTNMIGWQDEFRITKGVARYTTNYAPHTAAFPRNSGDPFWGSVIWLSSWDNGVIADDGPLGLPLAGLNLTAAITPDDGAFNYQSINQNHYPFDDNFVEAALISATNLLTCSANPVATNTVTVGTKAAATPAVYTFVAALTAAFQVLIGANIFETMSNLVSAINAQAGEGVTYGTGTTENLDVAALLEPSNQVLVSALVPGTAGNAIPSTSTGGLALWATATLAGGLDLPPYSQFGLSRMPSDTSVVESITIGSRKWKTDTGPSNTQISFVGPDGGILAGFNEANSTTPTVIFDTFEVDPDNPDAPLSPTAILLSKVRIDRLT